MTKDRDLSKLVPIKYQKTLPKLTISPVAYDYLLAESKKMEVEDIDTVLVAVADSAASFASSDYFSHSEWFRRKPLHSFKACALEQEETRVTPVLVLDRAAGRLLAESEVQFDPDYPEQRVLAETRVEFFPTAD